MSGVPRPIAEAIITAGGVKVGEVDPKTMASKKAPGLYFAGELLDVDAYTGGFNLQIAWATGRAAGESAAGPAWGRTCRERACTRRTINEVLERNRQCKHISIAIDGPAGRGKEHPGPGQAGPASWGFYM